jgi:hypothetical protein
LKKLKLIPYCNDLSALSQSIEALIEVVQDYVESGLDIDLNEIFDIGESGITLDLYNELIDQINSKIAFQNASSTTVH